MSEKQLQEKTEYLKKYLEQAGRVLVAFSSGVDSSFLLHMAHETLGENAAAVTAVSKAVPMKETEAAKEFCKERGIRQYLLETTELSIEQFRHNPKDRCYICKKAMFGQILEIAERDGFACILEGSNKDDESVYRPGMKALKELGIKSPLLEAGLTKEEIRTLSRKAGLSAWNKPSAACLYSRFPYGELLTEKKLKTVEQAEEFLKNLGFTQVRVRMHKEIARIEVLKEELPRLAEPETAALINDQLKQSGFLYVTADLAGFRSGSLDLIPEQETIE